MKNKANKLKLSQLLCTHHIGSNIELVSRTDSIVRHDEADIYLISYMLKAAAGDADIVGILSDDMEHEHVMPAVSREPAAPSKLMDVISCSCKAEGKACSGRCSCGSSGLSCTSYCVCEGGNNCCNPHTQQEEDEDEPQQSDVDSDDLAWEESD